MAKRTNITKDIIRDNALEIFKEKDYDDVTIMDICKKCGITKRTFYYHFESKAHIFSSLSNFWDVTAESLLEKFTEEEKSIDILWSLMKVYCDGAVSYGPKILKLLYTLTIQNGTSVHFPENARLFSLASKLLKKAQANKEIANLNNAEDIVYVLFHALRSISISWAVEDGGYDLVNEYLKSFYIIVGYPRESRKQIE